MKFPYENINESVRKILNSIAELSAEKKINTYLIGGYVRDVLLDRKNTDIDLCVEGDAVAFAEDCAKHFNKKLDAVYKRFGTALLNFDELKIEFASARKESYSHDSRKPIIEFTSIKDDLSRRDFTINALAVELNNPDKVIDNFNGLDDLKNKIIRTPLDPKKTFDDDPLRMMRAARFASQLNFTIDEITLNAAKEMRERVNDGSGVVSQERITDEFLKILKTDKPSVGLDILFKTGLMEIVFKEVSNLQGVEQRKDYHHKDVFYHTLEVVDNISKMTDNIWLRFTALVHDIAKPPTKKFIEGIGWTFHGHEELGARWQKKIFTRMKLPFEHLPYVEKLVRLHLRPIALADENVTDSAIRRLLFDAGEYIDDLLTLCRADITSKDPKKVKKYIANFDIVEKRIAEVEERDKIKSFQSPVRGEEIMKICNLEPSKKVGELKKMIEEAILDGEIPNEYDAALKYLHSIKDNVLSK